MIFWSLVFFILRTGDVVHVHDYSTLDECVKAASDVEHPGPGIVRTMDTKISLCVMRSQ